MNTPFADAFKHGDAETMAAWQAFSQCAYQQMRKMPRESCNAQVCHSPINVRPVHRRCAYHNSCTCSDLSEQPLTISTAPANGLQKAEDTAFRTRTRSQAASTVQYWSFVTASLRAYCAAGWEVDEEEAARLVRQVLACRSCP